MLSVYSCYFYFEKNYHSSLFLHICLLDLICRYSSHQAYNTQNRVYLLFFVKSVTWLYFLLKFMFESYD